MSIVDVPHHHVYHSRARLHRDRRRRDTTRVQEIYYILAVTAACIGLLLCTIGMLVLFSKYSRVPAENQLQCHNNFEDQVPIADHDGASTAEETTPINPKQEPAAGHSPEIIMAVSPLQRLLGRDWWEQAMSTDDDARQQEMQQLATMEESSLVIGETVVPQEHREGLVEYVRNQMEASRMITSKKQVEAILSVIRLNSSDLIFLRSQSGMFGSLRNSLTLALCTQKSGNIHFMLVILQVEAHLGWKFIPSRERSSWNRAMKASLDLKMRSETEKLLGLSPLLVSDGHADHDRTLRPLL